MTTNNKIHCRAKCGVQKEGVSGSHGRASVSGSDFGLRHEAAGTSPSCKICTVASLGLSNMHMIGAAKGGNPAERMALLWPEWGPHYLSGLLCLLSQEGGLQHPRWELRYHRDTGLGGAL